MAIDPLMLYSGVDCFTLTLEMHRKAASDNHLISKCSHLTIHEKVVHYNMDVMKNDQYFVFRKLYFVIGNLSLLGTSKNVWGGGLKFASCQNFSPAPQR